MRAPSPFTDEVTVPEMLFCWANAESKAHQKTHIIVKSLFMTFMFRFNNSFYRHQVKFIKEHWLPAE
jgi:hypothetical protein